MIRLNEQEFKDIYSFHYDKYSHRKWQRDWVDYTIDPERYLNNEIIVECMEKFVDVIRNAEKLKTMKAVIQSL